MGSKRLLCGNTDAGWARPEAPRVALVRAKRRGGKRSAVSRPAALRYNGTNRQKIKTAPRQFRIPNTESKNKARKAQAVDLD
ncbi:unnamed protein product, partial [Brenthis ino]